ncbi:MAG: flap endonuclease-1 [Nanoarchaeota archaeon]|nr:flap endonuclease-1 [Nanoarchaeota archaeon]
MGVKLAEIIPRKELQWEELKAKTIAIDTPNVLYQFLSSIRKPDGTLLTDSKGNVTSHLVGLFPRTIRLMEYGIRPVFVFDGKPPLLKKQEIERRRGLKEKASEKFKIAKEEGNEEEMLKYSRQSVKLTKEMIKEAQELISAFGLPVIQAPSEAEAQASLICRNADAWAVASQDYDALVYGTPKVIQNLTLAEKRKLPNGSYVKVYPAMIELKQALDSLNINQEQLLLLSVLVGTDFNPRGVKGIGPKKALKLVMEKSIPEIEKEIKKIGADFDLNEIMDVFRNMPVSKDYKIEFNDFDEEKIRKILIDKRQFSVERVESGFEQLKKQKEEKKQTSLFSFK